MHIIIYDEYKILCTLGKIITHHTRIRYAHNIFQRTTHEYSNYGNNFSYKCACIVMIIIQFSLYYIRVYNYYYYYYLLPRYRFSETVDKLLHSIIILYINL